MPEPDSSGTRDFCSHLDYLSQDFAQYDGSGDGSGLQTGSWDQSKIDIVSDIIDIPEPAESFDAVDVHRGPRSTCRIRFWHCREFARLLRQEGTS